MPPANGRNLSEGGSCCLIYLHGVLHFSMCDFRLVRRQESISAKSFCSWMLYFPQLFSWSPVFFFFCLGIVIWQRSSPPKSTLLKTLAPEAGGQWARPFFILFGSFFFDWLFIFLVFLLFVFCLCPESHRKHPATSFPKSRFCPPPLWWCPAFLHVWLKVCDQAAGQGFCSWFFVLFLLIDLVSQFFLCLVSESRFGSGSVPQNLLSWNLGSRSWRSVFWGCQYKLSGIPFFFVYWFLWTLPEKDPASSFENSRFLPPPTLPPSPSLRNLRFHFRRLSSGTIACLFSTRA